MSGKPKEVAVVVDFERVRRDLQDLEDFLRHIIHDCTQAMYTLMRVRACGIPELEVKDYGYELEKRLRKVIRTTAETLLFFVKVKHLVDDYEERVSGRKKVQYVPKEDTAVTHK